MKCTACKTEEHLDGWDISYSELSKGSVLFRFICPHCGFVQERWYTS